MRLPEYILLGLSSTSNAFAAPTSSDTASTSNATEHAVHNITRNSEFKFENMAIRHNGQILTTATGPNASIYQVDPLNILPLTLIASVPNISATVGIAEHSRDIFYFATESTQGLSPPRTLVPSSYNIYRIDLNDVSVLPNRTLTRYPTPERVANIPNAQLPNGIAFARSLSDNLLVADTFSGVIWNVDVCNGSIGVTLNDTSTRGSGASGGGMSSSAGINGIKVWNGTAYYTNTGNSNVYKVPVDANGNVPAGAQPALIAHVEGVDDLVLDHEGNAYVASPLDVLTKVTPEGKKTIIAGVFNSTSSPLIGPSSARFGRLESDRWSLYVTSNGGVPGVGAVDNGQRGVSRIDLGEYAVNPFPEKWE